MLGETFRGGPKVGLHVDSSAGRVCLQLCIHFRPLTGARPGLDLNAQLQAVPIAIGQALRGGVSFAICNILSPLLNVLLI